MRTRRRWVALSAAAGLTALTLGLLSGALDRAFAQEGGFPPFPVLIAGEVYVDGELLSEPATLTARIGDWESRPVDVTDGSFGVPPGIPVVVGPPRFDYVGQLVTFHLNGELEASFSFEFEALGEPAFRQVRLEFGAPRQQAAPTPTAPTVVSPAPSPDAGTGPAVGAGETGADGPATGVWILVGIAAGLVGLATVLGLRARRR